jgi:TRAP-type C4-dicarboxylate transport system permease small subunit
VHVVDAHIHLAGLGEQRVDTLGQNLEPFASCQRVFQSALVAVMTVFFILCCVGGWIYKHPETHHQFLALLPWLLSLLIVCRLLVAGVALRQGLRRGLLEPRTALRWLTAWVFLGSALFGLLAYVVPTDLIPVHYLAFAVLFAMPMARLTAAPLALAWNRHR